MSSVFPHNDYWMRSFSEVKWASMMDALELRWIYEPKVFETRHGMYLPDFFLYGANVYLEVKGPPPSTKEIEKAIDVQKLSGYPVVFAWGTMASDCDGVNGAKLSFLIEDKLKHIDSNEFAQLIEHGLGPKCFYNHLSIGLQQQYNGMKPVKHILQTVIFALVSREKMERDRASHHATLNKVKVKQHTVRTKSEAAILTHLRSRLRPSTTQKLPT